MNGPSLSTRLEELAWPALRESLDARGHALSSALLEPRECDWLRSLFEQPERFRKSVDMGRHSYGEGEYRYFGLPLPEPVAELRRGLYRHLAPLANDWSRRLRLEQHFPETLEGFLAECRAHGQPHPTPLLLRYTTDGYNRLHQDRYGDLVFPIQAVVCLSRPGRDFLGGEFLLVEQRPRSQARGEAIALQQGQVLLFAGAERPVRGRRGEVRLSTRHGLSRLHQGSRTALGIIFHDAAS